MAGYLTQGKLLGWSLRPEVMVGLASVLILQSGCAIIYRLLMLSGRASELPALKAEKSKLFRGALEEVSDLLKDRGLLRTAQRKDGAIFFTKGLKNSQVLEIIAYCGLVFALLSGTMNYGFGISGHVDISTGNRFIDLGTVSLNRAFLVRQSEPRLKVRASELQYATPSEPSTVVLEVADKDSANMTSYRLETGDSVSMGRFKMQYTGDTYIAFILVMKKKHDYRPVPIKLGLKSGHTGKTYTGMLVLREPGAKGEGEFDPASKTFRVKVYKNEELEFDGEFPYGESAQEGGFVVRVNALMHYGRFEIYRYGYRNQVIGGMGTFIIFLLARMIFRPFRVWVWSEGGRILFYTRNRAIKKLLLKGKMH